MSEAVEDRPGGLGRSAAVMAAGTATSRVLGVVRAAVLVAAIGQNSDPANAFALANWLPTMLYMLIAGGVLNAVLVPQVVRAYRSENGQEYVDRLLTISAVLLLAITAVLTLAAPVVVWLSGGRADGDLAALATAFALWCLPQVFFYGMYTLLGQVLNARGSFGPYMWAPVVNNIVSTAGMVVFIVLFGRAGTDGPATDISWWDGGRIALLGGSATLGIVLQAAILVVPLYRSGFRFRPRGQWRSAGLGTAGRVAGWTFAALVVGQLGVLSVINVAFTAAARSDGAADVAGNAAYGNAFAIFMLPHSLVTVSLLTALFTRVSTHAAQGDTERVRDDFSSGLRTISVFTLIATAVLCVLALPLARVVFPSLTPPEAGSLAPIVVAMTLGLGALGAWSLCQRVFYAYEDARGLFRIQVAMAGVVAVGSLLGSLLLPVQWWVAAAGGAIAASYGLGAVWGGLAVRARLGGTGSRVIRLHVRAGVAALLAAAVGWPVSRLFGDLSRLTLLPAVLACVLVGLLMLGVYLGLLRVLGVTELSDLVTPLRARLGRSMSGPGSAGAGHPDRPTRSAGSGDSMRGGDLLDGVVTERGTLLAGRYRLEEPLSTDLPGVESWVASDQILDRRVRALLLREGRFQQAQDAARRAALVNDPRLLRVLDVGQHQGLPYTITEPLVGKDLGELTAAGPLPPDQARSIIGEAAVALEIARRRGVHHLALRPSAVRVTADGKVVVSGLAMDGELAGHGLGDARSTTRADTVGLVALLYLALTGRWVPPPGARVAAGRPTGPGGDAGEGAPHGAPEPPAELVPGVPNDLDTLCAVTLGPNDDGPHSPAELVRELEPWGPVDAEALFRTLDAAPGWPTPTSAVPAGARGPAAGAVAGAGAAAATGVPSDPEPTTAAGPAADPREAAGMVDESTGAPDGAAGAAVGPPTEPPVSTGTVQRQSVRASVAGQAPAASPPGTPPPAIPPAFRRTDPRLAGPAPTSPGPVSPVSAAAHPDRTVAMAVVPPTDGSRDGAGRGGLAAAPPPALPPAGRGPAVTYGPAAIAATAGTGRPSDPRGAGGPTRGGAPDGGHQSSARDSSAHQSSAREDGGHENFDSLIGRSADVLSRTRFNPTPVVIGLFLLAVGIALWLAWNNLTAPTTSTPEALDQPLPTDAAPVDPSVSPPPEGSAPPVEPVPAVAAPIIATAQMLDPPPGGDNNEHPEAVIRAIDGDPATFWFTRTYNSPTYGMKPGVGYAVTLAAPATVTTVTLNVNGTGGMVEVRATDPSTPTTGEVLASGPLGPETVLTLSTPTQAQHIVLWFTALPQTADGSNRIELAQVNLS